MKILAFAASNHPQSINQQLALSTARLLPQAKVETLQLDHLGESEVELPGLEELLELGDQVGVVFPSITAELDRGLMRKDRVSDGVHVTTWNAIGVQRFEFGLGEKSAKADLRCCCLVFCTDS